MVTDEQGTNESVASDTYGTDTGTVKLTLGELRTTFEYQVQRLQEIDSKAIEILKANLLLIGIVITGGSILVQTDLEIAPFVNVFSVFGGLLLLSSTGLAAVTYTASNLRGGLDATAVESAITAQRTSHTSTDASQAFEEQLLRSYAQWIDYNARVTAVNDLLATVTVLLVFVSFVYVVAGVVAGVLGLSSVLTAGTFAGTTVVVSAFIWLAYNMDHLGPEPPQHHETFDGIYISKGATRRKGLSVLWGMLGRAPQSDDSGTENYPEK